MAFITLLRAGLKRHKRVLAGLFILLLLVSLCLNTVLSVWTGAGNYVREEMERLGFGDLTAWVSGAPDTHALAQELAALPEVGQVNVQPLLFADYRIGAQQSDSEGQLLAYDPARYPYRLYTTGLDGFQSDPAAPAPDEVYVSPALVSMFGAAIGDEISFPVTRQGVEKTFTIKGYFEDPFMGSSMIGMKSFLISRQDHQEVTALAADAGIDALARGGAMYHITQADKTASAAALNAALNERTSLPRHAESTHSAASIAGFMLILQNAFAGFLLAFVTVLLAVSMVVLAHSTGSAMEQDTASIGILKAIGFTGGGLRRVQLAQYLLPSLCGLALGLLGAVPLAGAASRMTVTATGLLLPAAMPLGLCAAALTGIALLLCALIWRKTAVILRIAPLRAIRGGAAANAEKPRFLPLRQKGLAFWMALRQLTSDKKQYGAACLAALLLVFFCSMMGRMNSWLGPNGEGIMDAFNPADLDLAVQPLGEVGREEIESVIARYSAISGRYELAMPTVAVNGMDFTANVITAPERFHLLAGRTSASENEVVLTEFAAADLNVKIGGTVTLSAGAGSGTFTVSGIYQCANDMGANIGLSRAGYARIGRDTPDMWCTHYFLTEPNRRNAAAQALETAFGHNVHVHQNTWPGLAGILSAMRALLLVMTALTALFIFVTVAMTGGRLLRREQNDLCLYRALGFSVSRLRLSFALRFGVTSMLGAGLGVALSGILTDPLVAAAMRLAGISSFASRPALGGVLLPALFVILLFTGFSYLAAGKIQKAELTALVAET